MKHHPNSGVTTSLCLTTSSLRMGRSDTRSPGIGTRYVSASWEHLGLLTCNKPKSSQVTCSKLFKCKQPTSSYKFYKRLPIILSYFFVTSWSKRNLRWKSSTGRGQTGGFCRPKKSRWIFAFRFGLWFFFRFGLSYLFFLTLVSETSCHPQLWRAILADLCKNNCPIWKSSNTSCFVSHPGVAAFPIHIPWTSH